MQGKMARSEERRVGKEGRCREGGRHYKAEDGIRVGHVTGVQTCALPIFHGGAMSDARVRMKWVQSDYLNEENVEETLGDVSAVLVAPGFGERGIDGKLTAVTYARENGKIGRASCRERG